MKHLFKIDKIYIEYIGCDLMIANVTINRKLLIFPVDLKEINSLFQVKFDET